MQKVDPEILAAWTALLVAHRRLTTQLDAELRQATGITLDEYDVLYQLRLAGRPLRMAQLAEHLLISRPTATRVVDRLVSAGSVRRRHDRHDRRVVLIALTEAGRRQQARAGRIHLDGIARLVAAPLEGHDVARLIAALRAIGEP